VGPPERRVVRRAFLQQQSETTPGSRNGSLTTLATAAVVARLRGAFDVDPPTAAANAHEESSGSEQSDATTTPTPPIESIDRRSPLMTLEQRDLLLRDDIMQMQIERLQNGL